MRLAADAAFAGINLEAELDPAKYVGRAPEQVSEFLAGVVDPIRSRYPGLLKQSADLHV